MELTKENYRAERIKRGTQIEVAKAIGITQPMISQRENGGLKINREAMLALCSLPIKQQKPQ